jgi:mannose-6-phosphate isomerase-like protein (cupin superfamily)
MGYSPSPRPTFSGPAHIPYQQVTRHLWGDEIAGEVADWIYVSSNKIHQLVFGLPPGQGFRHSEEFRTVFAADEVLYVLSGIMVLSNPETGEVHRVRPGEAAFFRRDTWHHAFNFGKEPLRVLELFAPPPSQGTSGAYARTKPMLTTSRYFRTEWLSKWPMSQSEAASKSTIRVLRESDLLWFLEGKSSGVLCGILASTEHLTVGTMQLLPGQKSSVHCHEGDESLYVLEGALNMLLPENEGQRWFELGPRDGFYVPEGVPHQYHNITSDPANLIFGVAPKFEGGGRTAGDKVEQPESSDP